MNQLPKPDEDVLKAFVRLEGNRDFQTIMDFLGGFCPAYVVQKSKRQAIEVALRWSQGAMQVLDDIKEISAKALEWIEAEYLKQSKQQKED
jgi:hypothetical protein